MGRQISRESDDWNDAVTYFELDNEAFLNGIAAIPEDLVEREDLMCTLFVLCNVDETEYEEYLDNKKVCQLGKYTFGSDWDSNMVLIPEDSWEGYAQEQAEEMGSVPKDFPSWIVIDWRATADNLKGDYSRIEIDGVTYLGHNS
jgi:hypothetical protein